MACTSLAAASANQDVDVQQNRAVDVQVDLPSQAAAVANQAVVFVSQVAD